MAKYITDELKKLIGIESKPVTRDIDRGVIRLFAQAIGDPNPLFNDETGARKTRFAGMIAPPTFCRTLIKGHLLKLDMPNLPKRLLDGGSHWKYFEPIRPGDRITVVTKLTDLRETDGRAGTMVFTVVENRYTNQFDDLCAIQLMTFINY